MPQGEAGHLEICRKALVSGVQYRQNRPHPKFWEAGAILHKRFCIGFDGFRHAR